MTHEQAERIRVLALWDAMGYPPTAVELASASAPGVIGAPMVETRGRITFIGRESLIEEHEKRARLFPRKLRRARAATKWLARLSGVRFVAICNTTALANARDEGDLDFFVITKTGVLTQTRGWASLRFALTGRRPGSHASERDAVCLSFFVDDSALDLSSLTLPVDDPYFRLWFLSLLPLLDDGVSADLWKANAPLLSRHPHAQPWIIHPNIQVANSKYQIPAVPFLERLAINMQARSMSPALREIMNKDSRVVINPHVLKFHADDGRERFKSVAAETCKHYGVDP